MTMHLKWKKLCLKSYVYKTLLCVTLLLCYVQCNARDNLKIDTGLAGSTYNISDDVLTSINTSGLVLKHERFTSDFIAASNNIETAEQTRPADENNSPDSYNNTSLIKLHEYNDDSGSHNNSPKHMQNNKNTGSGNNEPQDYDQYYDWYDDPENKTKFDLSIYDCDNNTCVTKCCPLGTILSFKPPHIGCVDPLPDEPNFEPKYTFLDGRQTVAEKQVLFIIGFPHELSGCEDSPVPEHRTPRLLRDGRLFTPYDDSVYRGVVEYCIDVYRNEDAPTQMNAFTCYTEYEETARSLFRFYAHSICLIISCVALMLMVMFHAFIPQFRDFQGLCLLSHICSLLVGNLVLVTATLWNSMGDQLCVAVGIILYFSFIATFMWLTVMCFDVWRYIRQSIKGIPSTLMRWQKKQLFIIYSCLVWGLTTILTIIASTLHFLPKDALPDYIIRPHFGVNRCFIIEEDANLFVYFFVVLIILCVTNICLIGMTVYYLHQGGVKMWCLNSKSEDTESCVFNAKYLDIFWQRFQIFALTIIVWTTEVLSWKIPPEELWELTDIINTLQGVIIFMIFLRQPAKRRLVLNLLKGMKGRANDAVRKISSIHTETSSTFVSNFFTGSRVEDPYKETIVKMRKLSNMEKYSDTTIPKSMSESKIGASDTKSGGINKSRSMEGRAFVEIDLRNESSNDLVDGRRGSWFLNKRNSSNSSESQSLNGTDNNTLGSIITAPSQSKASPNTDRIRKLGVVTDSRK